MSDIREPSPELSGFADIIKGTTKAEGVIVLTMNPNGFGVAVPDNERQQLLEQLAPALREMADALEADETPEFAAIPQVEALPDVIPEQCWCSRSLEPGFGEPCNQFTDNLEGYCLRCKHPQACHDEEGP